MRTLSRLLLLLLKQLSQYPLWAGSTRELQPVKVTVSEGIKHSTRGIVGELFSQCAHYWGLLYSFVPHFSVSGFFVHLFFFIPSYFHLFLFSFLLSVTHPTKLPGLDLTASVCQQDHHPHETRPETVKNQFTLIFLVSFVSSVIHSLIIFTHSFIYPFIHSMSIFHFLVPTLLPSVITSHPSFMQLSSFSFSVCSFSRCSSTFFRSFIYSNKYSLLPFHLSFVPGSLISYVLLTFLMYHCYPQSLHAPVYPQYDPYINLSIFLFFNLSLPSSFCLILCFIHHLFLFFPNLFCLSLLPTFRTLVPVQLSPNTSVVFESNQ